MDMSELCKAFARLTGNNLEVATQELTELVEVTFFSCPADDAPFNEDDLGLSNTYMRLRDFTKATSGDNEQLARFARISMSIGSYIVASGQWPLLPEIAKKHGITTTALPAKILLDYLLDYLRSIVAGGSNKSSGSGETV